LRKGHGRTDARTQGRTDGGTDRRLGLTGEAIDRREAIKVGVLAGYGLASPQLWRFQRILQQGPYQWRFFTAPELETMRVLAGIIIPRDERSGSATDAGTVEYADFALSESGERDRQAWHDGFQWLDAECGRRFAGRRFVECAETERAAVLDDIAWPRRAREEMRTGVEWFNRVRDLVGAGFFSSRMGVEDLGYQGGVFVPEWRGAPEEALRELGLSYDEWDRRYGGLR
jgi:hypothetical protein